MATEAYTSKELTLVSGKVLNLVPLSIKNLRKFMRIWSEHIDYMRSIRDMEPEKRPTEAELTDKQFDVYIELAVLGLEKVVKEHEDITDLREFIDDEIDEKSMYVILDITGGLKLDADDPNQSPGVQSLK